MCEAKLSRVGRGESRDILLDGVKIWNTRDIEWILPNLLQVGKSMMIRIWTKQSSKSEERKKKKKMIEQLVGNNQQNNGKLARLVLR